jgi:hypothetical protein
MALKRIPYTRLEPLLRECLSKTEDKKTLALVQKLRPARRRRYLTPGELEAVCQWKSARAIRHIRANSPWKVRSATQRAMATRSERQRPEVLRTLQGVSVPMASAILTLLDPRRYGVIDIRVWQLLYKLGVVARNRRLTSAIGTGSSIVDEGLREEVGRECARHRENANLLSIVYQEGGSMLLATGRRTNHFEAESRVARPSR